MHRTIRTGLLIALAAAGQLAACSPVAGEPAKTTAPKAATKPATTAPKTAPATKPAKAPAKPAPKPVALGKTPSETVSKLIVYMQKRNRDGIAQMFDWQRFAKEMNSLIPDSKGLEAATYKTLLVETLDVTEDVSKNLRVGKQTMKGKEQATVQMERLFPAGTEGGKGQYKPINVLSLYKASAGWKIYRLDSAQETAVVQPSIPRAPQGMVPAAGSGTKMPEPAKLPAPQAPPAADSAK